MNRRHSLRLTGSQLVVFALGLTSAFANSTIAQSYRLERIASGLNQPTYVTQAPGDPANILYYTERTQNAIPGFGATNNMGRVWRYDVNTRAKTMVLDLSNRSVTNDTGLQTIAFHPDFNTPATPGFGKLYVSSAQSGATALNRVEEFNVDLSGPTPTYAATISRLLLQYQNNAQNNHTIDWVGFDPTAVGDARNYLYISTGDGSFGNNYNGGISPTGRPSQNPNDIAGKMLRVNVVGADAYPADPLKNFAIPASNPIPTYNAAHPGSPISGLGEAWITGLRNVYRASFDRANGDLWMGDVGEVVWEEVSFLKAGTNASGPPVDYGWPQREATIGSGITGAPQTTVNPFTGVTSLEPLQDFIHDGNGEAVIGGYRYRGPVAELQGKYFYADFVGTASAATIWSLDFDRNTPTASYNGNNGTNTEISALWQSLVFDRSNPSYLPNSTTGSSAGLDHIVSFGEDNTGNVYIVDFGNGSGFEGQYPGAGLGEIFKIVPYMDISVTVDRDTGEMTFENETGQAAAIRGYSLLSVAGAINSDEFTPITDRLDAFPNGDGSIDPVNFWEVTSETGDQHEFGEASTGGSATLSIGEQFVLSPGDGWTQSIYEDLSLSIIMDNGTEAIANVEFIGNGGQPFDRSDLNFSGTLDAGDWNIFKANHEDVMLGLTKVQSYLLGDLDGDGDNDFTDFRLFQADYIAANGAGAFAALLSIPEPSGFVLMLTLAVTATWFRRRRRRLHPIWLASVATAAVSLLASSAPADLVRQYTFNNGTANDSIGNAHGTLNGNATIGIGVLELPGAAGDFVSLPGATINMTSFTDATFEAWFTWEGGGAWQRVFDFGRTQVGGAQDGQGFDYIFYSPNGPGNDSRAAIRNNQLAENVVGLGAAVSQNTAHHVAVVVDNNSNGGTDTIALYLDGAFVNSAPMTYAFNQLSNSLAYLGRSLWNADTYLNGSIDEFRIYNHPLTATEVGSSFAAGPVPLQLLELDVNTFTGEVAVRNSNASPLSFDYYRVTSPGGALSPAGWTSLDDQNVDSAGPGAGQSWDEAGGPDANEVAELYLLGASTVAPNGSRQLGQLFNPTVFGKRQDGDVVFEYASQGGGLRQGFVNYITPPPLPGDYNDNGVVDAADYVVWRNHLNTSFQLPNEVAGASEGFVNAADYDAWKVRFGNVLSGAAAVGTLSVPEPSSAALILISLVCTGGRCVVARRFRVPRVFQVFLAICVALGGRAAVRAEEPKLLELSGDLAVHDPAMIKAGDTYYLFATGGFRNNGVVSQFTSPDMRQWTRAETVFPELPKWVADEVPKARNAWAPDISFFNNEYHLYYSLSSFGVNHSAIALATNKTLDRNSPDFQWIDEGLVVRSRPDEDDFNAIDPNVVVESDDRAWLTWGSFWGGIMLRELDPHTGKLSTTNTTLYKLASRPRGDKHQTPPIEGAIEAPFIVRHGDHWYLFVSWDFCCRGARSDYKVVVGRAEQVTGPYRDRDGKLLSEGGGTLILEAATDQWRGAGHSAVYREGDVDYLAFHAYSAETGRSRLQISTIVWQDGWPRVASLP